ncbi:hypothetical protein GCM10022296_13710 [Secundilactobacillus similis DSM 23365 = JCM 2765]
MPIKTSNAERQQVKQLWISGERNVSQIGRMMGHSHGWVTNRLAELGVTGFKRRTNHDRHEIQAVSHHK